MSQSSWMLIHGPSALYVKPYGCRKQTRKIVCCCPWSSPDAKKVRLPPGPSMLNLVGILPYVIRSFPFHYPLRDLAKTYGPLMHIKIGQASVIVVSSAELAEEALKTHDLACANRPNTVASEVLCYNSTNILFSPYGEYWKRMRQVCSLELLSPKNVRSSELIRMDEACGLIESIMSNSGVAFDVTETISLFVYSVTSRVVCGRNIIPLDNGVATIKAMKEGLSSAGVVLPADLFPSMKLLSDLMSWPHKYKMMRLRKGPDKLAHNIILEHRNIKKGDGDLVDALLQLQQSGQADGFSITDDNIKAVMIDMVVAGTESSASVVNWAMVELMKNPRVMAEVQDEIRQSFRGRTMISVSDIGTLKYLKLVIKETLRLHPPVSIIPRACREAFDIDGYHIPLNAYILVNNWWIGRDPKYWRNSESFEPERFEENPIDFYGKHFEYIPFGSGKRICPGMTLGLASVEFLLARLLYYFDWKLPHGMGPNDIDMTEVGGISVSKKTSLYLIATPSPYINHKNEL